jgi:hypothetical protein
MLKKVILSGFICVSISSALAIDLTEEECQMIKSQCQGGDEAACDLHAKACNRYPISGFNKAEITGNDVVWSPISKQYFNNLK